LSPATTPEQVLSFMTSSNSSWHKNTDHYQVRNKACRNHHVLPSPPFKFTGMFCKKRPHLSAASRIEPHPSSPIQTTYTFSTFLFVRPVEGQPEHSPSSTMFPHISIHKTNHKSLFSPWNCQKKVFWTHIICFQHSFPKSDAKVKINVLFLKMSH
jgi:hypothetical protein